MLYISRPGAVKERLDGTILIGIPKEVTNVGSYAELRESLEAFAWSREESERRAFKASGRTGDARSHYRSLMSFPGEKTTPAIERLIREWLSSCLSKAVVCGFVHRNSERVHIHLWIDSRGSDGKKLEFSYSGWRSLSKHWDRIYQRDKSRQINLEQKLQLKADDKDRAQRADRSSDVRTSKDQTTKQKNRFEEPEAQRCSKAREAAVREVESLRSDIEAMDRAKARGGIER